MPACKVCGHWFVKVKPNEELCEKCNCALYRLSGYVAPVVHGHWIKDNNSLQTDDYYCCYFDYSCSECGKFVNDRNQLPKYCPNCGAKMDGGNQNV